MGSIDTVWPWGSLLGNGMQKSAIVLDFGYKLFWSYKPINLALYLYVFPAASWNFMCSCLDVVDAWNFVCFLFAHTIYSNGLFAQTVTRQSAYIVTVVFHMHIIGPPVENRTRYVITLRTNEGMCASCVIFSELMPVWAPPAEYNRRSRPVMHLGQSSGLRD